MAITPKLIPDSKLKMKKLLFIQGNRAEISKANVYEMFLKIKVHGYIESMPIEYFPMKDIKGKLDGYTLQKPCIKRLSGEGDPTISNFELKMEPVNPEEYDEYDGICEDGQHRVLALMFDDLKDVTPSYKDVTLPSSMSILEYIAIRNNGKKWTYNDFFESDISTKDSHVDHIVKKRKEGYIHAFLLPIYTLETSSLTPSQVKAMQQGYKKISDFGKVQLNSNTQQMGDQILEELEKNSFLSKDRLSGRLGKGLKLFYQDHHNIDIIKKTINAINKEEWERYFIQKTGNSMEAKAYKDAFDTLYQKISTDTAKPNVTQTEN